MILHHCHDLRAMNTLRVERVIPQSGVRGGRVKVYGTGLDAQRLADCRVVFGSYATRPALTTTTLLLAIVPDEATPQTIQLQQNERLSNPLPFTVGTLLAENLHPVANPVVDRQGNIYTTISGTKGQSVPVSLYRVTRFGEVEPFAEGILNPTSLAFGPDGDLYVSSRHEGTVFRVDMQGHVSPLATNLGIATGLAFDALGQLYVGDRRGAIYRVSEAGQARLIAKLGPSVTAYHLAFGPDERLYVSFPTLAGEDNIYRLTPAGEVQIFVSGLGRAQGIAFDVEDNLYAIAYTGGEGGVVRITPDGALQHVIAGIHLVGLAFGVDGELILADNSALYKMELGVHGRSLP
jgi:sugar lactone lactonase YvrE